MKTIGQYYEFVFSKVVKFFSEKRYKFEGGQLRYIFKGSGNSDKLIVILSACTRKGIKARYNYMRTLSDCMENQLYILDDFGYDKRGAYYLGKGGSNEIERACVGLIEKIRKESNSEKIIFCGTSKGAYAALDLAVDFENSAAVVGAPQYRLADYLIQSGSELTADYILKDRSEAEIGRVNNYLKDRLSKSKNHKVYLHYSDKEHTYGEHIVFLLRDLNELGYDVKTEVLDYSDHWDVGKYFPKWLNDSLKKEGCCFR